MENFISKMGSFYELSTLLTLPELIQLRSVNSRFRNQIDTEGQKLACANVKGAKKPLFKVDLFYISVGEDGTI